MESVVVPRILLPFVAVSLLACQSFASSDYPNRDVSRMSQVSFEGSGTTDRLTIAIHGSPCYEASLAINISSANGTQLYKYESRFKPHVAVQWDDSRLDGDAEQLADRLVDPESFGLTSDLPPWRPDADYYEEHYQSIKISKEEYEKLRKGHWITYTHPIHYQGWRVAELRHRRSAPRTTFASVLG